MNDLISQTALYLAAAGLLGVLLGWWIGRAGRGKGAHATEEDWQQRFAAADAAHEEAAEEVQRLAAQLSKLKIEVEEANDRATRLTSELDESEQQLTTGGEDDAKIRQLRGEIETWRDEVSALQDEQLGTREDAERLASDLLASRKNNAELEEQGIRSRQRVEELESALVARTNEDDELRSKLARLGEVKREFQEWMQGAVAREEELDYAKRQLEVVGKERDRAASDLAALTRELEEARQKSKVSQSFGLERAELRDEVARRDGRISDLERDLAASSEVQYEAESLRAELAGNAQQIKELGGRLEEAESDRDRVVQELESLLNPPLAGGATQGLEPAGGTATESLPAPDHGPERLGEPRGAADDLKRIQGIGPVLERTLNSLGVYHFSQIAGWSETDIQWIAAHINTFPDRIVRDGWAAQAEKLLREKRDG
ncbi:MAG: hypothetical protein O7A04_08775 [Acidobacteria bacterium]|nr:hypothetical protein [Acidobacteriota bacterium]